MVLVPAGDQAPAADKAQQRGSVGKMPTTSQRRLTCSPRGARRGNLVAAVGMVLAVAWTVVAQWSSFTAAGLVICVIEVAIGAVARTVGARNVKMTAMLHSSWIHADLVS